MDSVDQALLAALRRNARASVSDLAMQLNVSRATIRMRMERLTASGEITGFTVSTRTESQDMPVRALMMIGIEGRGGERIMARLAGLTPVTRVHSTNGKWDVILELATETLQELDAVIYRIRDIEGVMTSETNLLLSSRGGRAL